MHSAYIFDAIRTPRGKGRPATAERKGGSLSEVPPQTLIAGLVDALAARQGETLSENAERLILGCVGQIGVQGGHIALVSRLASALPDGAAVKTLNNYCVSALTAVIEGAAHAQAGMAGLTLAGGVECLSQVDFLADRASYYSDPKVMQTLRWAPPIMGAELIATLESYGKADLDEITAVSHQRAAKAWEAGHYAPSTAPVISGDGSVILDRDELIRPDLNTERLARMRPAFAAQGAEGFDDMIVSHYPDIDAIDHVHSIANCPGMADGASLVVIGNEEAGHRAGLKPMARIVATAECGGDPVYQFGAGFAAMENVLEQTGMSLADMDRIEFMEAFAAVPLKFLRDYDVDPDIVNVNGGHLAMGHPLGATGGILVATLVHELVRSGGDKGLVVGHAGGGIGAAMIIERV